MTDSTLLLSCVSALLWLAIVNHDRVIPFFESGESIPLLELRKELVLHGAFYGSAVAAILGVATASLFSKFIAAAWFILGLWYSRVLAVKINELEQHHKTVHWRKLAGMIRSVVKSELTRSPAKETA